MGRLAGSHYRQVVRRLKALGFGFDPQAAGSHEIWYSPATNRYTTVPTILATCPKGPCGPS
jgi:predicted RNA binding protein YcfA (HicA-like mRNA interferase family)